MGGGGAGARKPGLFPGPSARLRETRQLSSHSPAQPRASGPSPVFQSRRSPPQATSHALARPPFRAGPFAALERGTHTSLAGSEGSLCPAGLCGRKPRTAANHRQPPGSCDKGPPDVPSRDTCSEEPAPGTAGRGRAGSPRPAGAGVRRQLRCHDKRGLLSSSQAGEAWDINIHVCV